MKIPRARGPRGAPVCSRCGAAFGPYDGREVVRTRAGRRLEELIFPVTGWWCGFLAVAAFLISLLPARVVPFDRGFGWMLISVPAMPGFAMWVASWFFPHVRRFQCRECGHVEERPFKEGTVPGSTENTSRSREAGED